jgi:hypothetical protein
VKPGDLVEPDTGSKDLARIGNERQIGLVLSHPEVKDHGTTCVLVEWIGWNIKEYYSIHHLRLVNDE